MLKDKIFLTKLSEKNSLTLYREMNHSWGKNVYIEWCSREERIGIAWMLVRGVAVDRNKEKKIKKGAHYV
jgi:hypothetical protein